MEDFQADMADMADFQAVMAATEVDTDHMVS